MTVIKLPNAHLRERSATRAKAAANRANLTEDKVAALVAKRKDYYVWDGGGRQIVRGLHVHVQPTATKTFRYSFKFKRAKAAISYKLGRWPGLTLEEARQKATEAAKLVSRGIDPRTKDAALSGSFEATVLLWHKREQVQRLQNVSADSNRDFVLRVCAHLKHRPIADITKAEISNALAKLIDRGCNGSAVRARAHLKCLFDWCVDEDLVPISPVKKKCPVSAPKPRQRPWFTGKAADPIIKSVWDYASRIGGDEGLFLKLTLITGKRVNAVAKMRWEQIDDAWYWTPVVGNKRKLNNPIPLPKLAQRVLGQRGTGSLFAGVIDDTERGCINARVKRAVDPTFFLHGIRHVVATKLAELKVAPHVARLVLDHTTKTDAHSGYEHVDWTEEMRDALERWCSYLERVLVPAGVSVLR